MQCIPNTILSCNFMYCIFSQPVYYFKNNETRRLTHELLLMEISGKIGIGRNFRTHNRRLTVIGAALDEDTATSALQ